MKARNINYTHLSNGMAKGNEPSPDNVDRDIALDQALRSRSSESIPMSSRTAQQSAHDISIDSELGTPSEKDRSWLRELGITFDGRQYRYRKYSYGLLADALAYARLDRDRSTTQETFADISPWREAEQPTSIERQLMIRIGITYDGQFYRYHGYRYDHLLDAVLYAEVTRVTGVL